VSQVETAALRFSASRLKKYMACPLQAYFRYVEHRPEQQNAAAVFGTVVHKALQVFNDTSSYTQAVETFRRLWNDPEEIGLHIDFWPRYTNYQSYLEKGLEVLERFRDSVKWDQRQVIATEHAFLVPFGEYELTGIVDLTELRRSGNGKRLLRVVDYKSGQTPNQMALREDIQFHIYVYAVDQPEFWVGNGPDFPGLPDGERLFEELRDVPRRAIWWQLTPPKEIDAGPRDEEHYLRLYRVCQQVERAHRHEVFIPRLGEACQFCSYTQECGVPFVQHEKPAEDPNRWI
jgi:RecB family exonuclease